jgi:hypothetical protein
MGSTNKSFDVRASPGIKQDPILKITNADKGLMEWLK